MSDLNTSSVNYWRVESFTSDNYISSSDQTFLVPELKKKCIKHRKILVGVGVTVFALVIVISIVISNNSKGNNNIILNANEIT